MCSCVSSVWVDVLVFQPASREHRFCGFRQISCLLVVTLQSWGCRRKWLSSACWFSAYKWLVWLNLYRGSFWGFKCLKWQTIADWRDEWDNLRRDVPEVDPVQRWLHQNDWNWAALHGYFTSLDVKGAATFCQAYLLPEVFQFPLWFPITGGLFCNRTFDRYACWPDAAAGSLVNISCPFYLPWFHKG